ncbi:pyridoxal phosphate-dependent aminotransferase [Aeromonas jandaei]
MKNPFDIQHIYKPNWVLLDQSENPFGFAFNRYPNLKHEQALYKSYIKYINTDLCADTGLKIENMLFTRGAADAIDLILRTFCLKNKRKVVATNPTFFPLKHWSRVYGIPLIKTPLNGTHYNQLDIELILESKADVCFVINPNNPTSTTLEEGYLQRLIDSFNGLIVVDEAYVDFCHDETVVSKLKNNPNIMVLRTMSKAWGSAGIRGGFIIGSEKNILSIKGIQPPFMCDSYVCEHLTNLLNHRYEEFCLFRSLIIESRNRFMDFLSSNTTLTVLPSQTNFIVIQTPNSGEIEKVLYKNDFIVKRTKFRESECIRISIGTPIEMDRLTSVFKSEAICAVI